MNTDLVKRLLNYDAGQVVRLIITFATRVIAALGSSVLTFLIAHTSSPSVLGQFALFISLLGAFSIVSRRGLDFVLIRVIAQNITSGSHICTLSYLQFALRKCLWPTLILSIIGSLLLTTTLFGEALPGSGVAFAVALPMFTWLALVSGYFKGLGLPWVSPFFEIGGVSAAAGIIIASLLILDWMNSSVNILVCFIAALGFVSIVAKLLLTNRTVPEANKRVANKASWSGDLDLMLVALSTFLLQSGAFVIAAPFIDNTQLGLLRAAERLAVIVSFPGVVINSFIGAQIVHQITKADFLALRKTMRLSMLLGGLIAFPPLMVFTFFPEISLTFLGDGYIESAPYLRLMAIANFVVVIFFPYCMLISLGGLERSAMKINLAFLGLGLILFPLFAMLFGAIGFTIVYAIISVTRIFTIFARASHLGE
ncbi:lipopolysaccharide biosynthesis protein [Kordiimonas pumila]|uniref:Lipopolysaccharide biosynthesis protein n=1 Tax=Kordiimonas pumila TaxID=2161677 RepID=A0ABV7D5X5_9PROT|nr:hypothetical protein [Kordiimonas pumila]